MDLEELRKEIDKIDTKLLELLVERFKITEKVGHYKAANNMPVVAPEREEEMMNRLRDKAESAGLAGEHAENIWRAIINEVVKNHKSIRDSLND